MKHAANDGPRGRSNAGSPMTPRQRSAWMFQGASMPSAPVALDGHSARGLLSMLEKHVDAAAHEARAQLNAALATGDLDAVRAAMARARSVLAGAASLPNEAQPVERSEAPVVTVERPTAAPPQRVRSQGPDPHQVLAQLDDVLAGELAPSTRKSFEQRRQNLARALETGAKSVCVFAHAAVVALKAYERTNTRRAVSMCLRGAA